MHAAEVMQAMVAAVGDLRLAFAGRLYAAVSVNDRFFVAAVKTIIPSQGVEGVATIASASLRVVMDVALQWGRGVGVSQ
jgi:hypothetical protein